MKCVFILLSLCVSAYHSLFAYTPKVELLNFDETSIDGEIYENGEILTVRTPVRYYYYKILEEPSKSSILECRQAAMAWAKTALPESSSIRGLAKVSKLTTDQTARQTMHMQNKLLDAVKRGREDIIEAYTQSVRFHLDLKCFDSVAECYRNCLKSRSWRKLSERGDAKRLAAFSAINEILALGGSGEYYKGVEICIQATFSWEFGALQNKIDDIYTKLIDLKKKKIAELEAKEDASAPQAATLRRMRKVESSTKKHANVARRAARRAVNAAGAAAMSAEAAASSAADAASSASAAEQSARDASQSAIRATW